MRNRKLIYSAMYLSGDLGTRFKVTAGHDDLESARTAVDRWCEEQQQERLSGGEVVICCGVAPKMREIARLVSGEWRQVGPPRPMSSGGTSFAPLEI